MLETVEATTGSPVDRSIIWLHGLGADGHDFEPVVPALRLHGQRIRFVFPHAPVRPVTVNGGMRMRAWYDVLGLDLGSRQDEQGIRESAGHVRQIIEHENERGIPSENIVLAGFSQGGATALHTALRFPERFAGIIALSTYLPLTDRFDAEAHPANRETPIFMGHGTMDPLVPLALGQGTHAFLVERDYRVSWNTYPIPHAVSPQEIMDLGNWLRERF